MKREFIVHHPLGGAAAGPIAVRAANDDAGYRFPLLG